MQPSLSALARGSSLTRLADDDFDCVIIGGGITGAGIFRYARLQGLNVALLETGDYAIGTSSRSTKLIHGGLRYLAMGEFSLVRATALERKTIQRLAPHLVEPRWLLVPSRSRLEALKYRTAISIYEMLGAVAKGNLHQNWSSDELFRQEPLLDTHQFPYACAYREYLSDDARLVIANIRAGVEAGGVACNYLKAVGLVEENGKSVAVQASCQLSGEELTIRAKRIVNAAGPWVEEICAFDSEPVRKALHLSKGIHVTVDRDKLPLNHMVLLNTLDGRILFAIPRGDFVYLGTTDTSFGKPAALWPEIHASEVEYVLEPVARYFGIRLGLDDCFSAWSGLRPLISEAGRSTEMISRKDEIWVSATGLITVAGGKLTGFLKMARRVVDLVMDSVASSPVRDVNTPLPGGEPVSPECLSLPASDATRLIRLYGSDSLKILELGSSPLVEGGNVLTGEVYWAVEQEGAVNLEDVIYRRTRAALYNRIDRTRISEPAALLMAGILGWSDQERIEQVAAVEARLREDLAFKA